MTIKRYVSIKEIPTIYPGVFTEASIRWLVFNEKQNGFYKCIRRIGRKVIIDLDLFETWIDEQGSEMKTKKIKPKKKVSKVNKA